MPRQTYSLDFKVSAVKLITEQGRGLKDAATSLGVAPNTMRYWVQRFAAPRALAPAPTDHDTLLKKNLRLRDENKRLTMEREILKRAMACFARARA